jgi:CheY-like chemotaxis protein
MKDIRILLVEDDRENCLMLKEVLGKWGYLVTEAYSGEEAINRSRKEAFDIVLTDIRMARQQARRPEFRRPPGTQSHHDDRLPAPSTPR